MTASKAAKAFKLCQGIALASVFGIMSNAAILGSFYRTPAGPEASFATVLAVQNQTCQPRSNCSVHASNETCLTPECLQQVALGLARAYPDRSDHSWCVPGPRFANETAEASLAWRGILLTKVPKAASTTAAGVALRLSKRHGDCLVQRIHVLGTRYQNRLPDQSFLFTSIRDPASRAVSALFFKQVSQGGKKPTNPFMLRMLRKAQSEIYGTINIQYGGFQARYTSTRVLPDETRAWDPSHPNLVLNPLQIQDQVRHIVNAYDFMIVTERMDESLVALSILLGVPVGDVLVTSSKVSGSYHFRDLKSRGGMVCTKMKKSFVSDVVQAHLESGEWRAKNYGDYLLHATANASLDKTIQQIGKERFETSLAEYQRLRALETEHCAPFVQFPCSRDGEPQPNIAKENCYVRGDDVGCGYRCIDSLIENYTSASQH